MSESSPTRVLIVDDNHTAADTLTTLVRLLGHEAIASYDGTSALQAAQTFNPHVVLLDLVMPDVDGFAVAKLLRKMQVPAKLVALTGFTQPAFVETAEDCGFDTVVAKPATAEQLAKLLTH